MKIAVDSNVFIYYLEDNGELGDMAEKLLESVVNSRNDAVASDLVYLELLSDPDINSTRLARTTSFLESSAVKFEEISKDILLCAADLRRSNKPLKAPDAIHLATAILRGCDIFVTNDKKLAKATTDSVEIVLLTDFSDRMAA